MYLPQFDIDPRLFPRHGHHHQPTTDYRLRTARQPRDNILHAGKKVLHADGQCIRGIADFRDLVRVLDTSF
jgi:hypothetical protein